jgi:hypothetical protein
MENYLRRFKKGHGTECGLLRAWRAGFAGVRSTSPPPGKLQATRKTLAGVALRLRELGIASGPTHQFIVASDPFR